MAIFELHTAPPHPQSWAQHTQIEQSWIFIRFLFLEWIFAFLARCRFKLVSLPLRLFCCFLCECISLTKCNKINLELFRIQSKLHFAFVVFLVSVSSSFVDFSCVFSCSIFQISHCAHAACLAEKIYERDLANCYEGFRVDDWRSLFSVEDFCASLFHFLNFNPLSIVDFQAYPDDGSIRRGKKSHWIFRLLNSCNVN